jgi:hypothetical protein
MSEFQSLEQQEIGNRMSDRLAALRAILPRVAHRRGGRVWALLGRPNQRKKGATTLYQWRTAQAETMSDLQKAIYDPDGFVIRAAFDLDDLNKYESMMRSLFAERFVILERKKDSGGNMIWPFAPLTLDGGKPYKAGRHCSDYRRVYLVCATRYFRKGCNFRVVIARNDYEAESVAYRAWRKEGIYMPKIRWAMSREDFFEKKAELLNVAGGGSPHYLWPPATDEELDIKFEKRRLAREEQSKGAEAGGG